MLRSKAIFGVVRFKLNTTGTVSDKEGPGITPDTQKNLSVAPTVFFFNSCMNGEGLDLLLLEDIYDLARSERGSVPWLKNREDETLENRCSHRLM